jgi:hypothetical protein
VRTGGKALASEAVKRNEQTTVPILRVDVSKLLSAMSRKVDRTTVRGGGRIVGSSVFRAH